jgi:hypothetical protein|tara:strand:+ start:1033 stop:1155 length:123 start_codon:yes stop_codon:yes gene_type:complete
MVAVFRLGKKMVETNAICDKIARNRDTPVYRTCRQKQDHN